MARNAVAAKKRKQSKIDPAELAPGIAKGLTQGVSVEEALHEHPIQGKRSGIVIAQDFARAQREMEEDPRLKRVHFIAELDTDTEVIEPNTGRRMIDVNVKMPDALRRKIQTGYACINCYEQFEVPWPIECNVCGYNVAARQTQRAWREFEGETHVGPSKGIRAILEERDAEQEKRIFREKLEAGKSPMRGLRA